ncbi:hypothetical protein [Aquirhabdus sp.]|uniref:hypothetical protein n=1 Tax=Aquirhabdus sp. TaxID=2824160 RepID=UPI00396CC2D8
MSLLAAQAELHKLADKLDVPVDEIRFLTDIPPEALRHLRTALTDRVFDQQRPLFRWFAAWVRWFPVLLSVLLVRFWIGATLATRVASELPAWRVADIAKHLSAEFMADVAMGFDPRVARELVRLLPVAQIVEISEVLLKRRDFMTMGRFVGLLPDQVVREVAASIEDEGDLLEIVFNVESRERIDHLVHVLPPERIRLTILIVCDVSKRLLWPKLLALVTNVSDSMKRELGDFAASQGEDVLEAIIRAADEDGLWEDILPVVACLSLPVQQRVVNLPALHAPLVMQHILDAANREELWTDMLTLAANMNDAGRDAVADAMTWVDDSVLERVAYAALLRAQWGTALDVVRRLPVEWHERCVQVLAKYTDTLDPETANQIRSDLALYGITQPVSQLA